MENELLKQVLENYPKAYQLAFETAVRTGTALVRSNAAGEAELYYPPFRYIMVPIESEEQQSSP